MRLRPHHLLCTQTYRGMGYSPEFVKTMDAFQQRIREEETTEIQLVSDTDDFCAVCPHKLGENLCESNANVKRYDAGVIRHFHLQEKTYTYQKLTAKIREELTPEIAEDICGKCSWYEGTCKDLFREMLKNKTRAGSL